MTHSNIPLIYPNSLLSILSIFVQYWPSLVKKKNHTNIYNIHIHVYIYIFAYTYICISNYKKFEIGRRRYNQQTVEQKKEDKTTNASNLNSGTDNNEEAEISPLVVQKMNQALHAAQQMKTKSGAVAASNNRFAAESVNGNTSTSANNKEHQSKDKHSDLNTANNNKNQTLAKKK
ncbi:hypothetical protein RFI_17676, partial [Reticulomyxa filosa]